MKVELEADFLSVGLGRKTHADCFKGRVGDMLDAYIAMGGKVKGGKEAKMASLRDRAVAKLAERGKAAEALDLSAIEL